MANNRYNFESPSAEGADAVTAFLDKQKAYQRQAILDSLAQRESGRQDEELKLRTAQEKRLGDYQQQTFKDVANSHEATQANAIVDDSMPGDSVDPITEALLKRQHREGAMQMGAPKFLTQDPDDIKNYDAPPTPGHTEMRGGSRYMQAAMQAQERADQARLTQEAETKRNDSDNGRALDVAKIMAASRAAAAHDTGSYLGPALDAEGKTVPGKGYFMQNGKPVLLDMPTAGGVGPKPTTKPAPGITTADVNSLKSAMTFLSKARAEAGFSGDKDPGVVAARQNLVSIRNRMISTLPPSVQAEAQNIANSAKAGQRSVGEILTQLKNYRAANNNPLSPEDEAALTSSLPTILGKF